VTRLLVPDFGYNLGWAFFQPGEQPASGTEKLRGSYDDFGELMIHYDFVLSTLMAKYKPTVVGYAEIFIAQKMKRWVKKNGQWVQIDVTIRPESIAPLFAMEAKTNELSKKRRLDCVKVNEQEARGAFLHKIPHGTKLIKEAVFAGATNRGWAPSTHHAADALCVGDFILAKLDPSTAHTREPLFIQGKPLCLANGPPNAPRSS
jgi:hypothetical protein